MLGCQDFCGHYEWTFHYFRSRWGQDALRRLWAEAIGGESQQHYAKVALQAGLRGLYDQYVKTGEEEHCDWTYTLDESKNVLRCDMRECPSKGFLIKNNLNVDEDYCDHCQGWELPLTASVGLEIVEHEHNHCGQCWTVYRLKDRSAELVDVAADIRKDERWRCGFIHRWEKDRRLPLLSFVSESSDPCDVLVQWFAANNCITILGDDIDSPGASREPPLHEQTAVLTTDNTYANRERCPVDPVAVLIGHDAANLTALATRFLATSPGRRPLLLHPYLPRMPILDFVSLELPRPIPILPLLIRCGLYVHQPSGANPGPVELLFLLALALQKRISLAGVDIHLHPKVGRLLVKHKKD